MDRLNKPLRYVNDVPETPLDNAGPEAIATAAVAHALLALVSEVHDLSNSVDEAWRRL